MQRSMISRRTPNQTTATSSAAAHGAPRRAGFSSIIHSQKQLSAGQGELLHVLAAMGQKAESAEQQRQRGERGAAGWPRPLHKEQRAMRRARGTAVDAVTGVLESELRAARERRGQAQKAMAAGGRRKAVKARRDGKLMSAIFHERRQRAAQDYDPSDGSAGSDGGLSPDDAEVARLLRADAGARAGGAPPPQQPHSSMVERLLADPSFGGKPLSALARCSSALARSSNALADGKFMSPSADTMADFVVEDDSTKELKRRLRTLSYTAGGEDWVKLFTDFDVDKSGGLERVEFVNAVRRGAKVYSSKISDEDLATVFDVIDTGGDGLIQVDEFLRWMLFEVDTSKQFADSCTVRADKRRASRLLDEPKRLAEIAHKLRAASYTALGANLHSGFTFADTDHNWALDLEEFVGFIRRTGRVSRSVVSDGELEELFLLVDADSDGSVSETEYLRFVSLAAAKHGGNGRHDFEHVRAVLAKATYGLDLGKSWFAQSRRQRSGRSGQLSCAAFISLMRRARLSKAKCSDLLLAEVFFAVDLDDNGDISASEFEVFLKDGDVEQPSTRLDEYYNDAEC